MSGQPHIGGSFAPPITPGKMARYLWLANAADDPMRSRLQELCVMVQLYLAGGTAKGVVGPGPDGTWQSRPLAREEVRRMEPHVPWDWEVDAMGLLFAAIDPVAAKELRDAAHHLLWFARELSRDLRPLTADRLHLPPTTG